MTHALGRYALAMTSTVALAAWALTFALTGDGASSAIVSSAVVAGLVQIAAFAMTRTLVASNLTAAWVAGALLRFLTLVIYGLLGVKVFGLPALPALVSLFVFFFLSMLLEPLFLRR